MSSEASDYRGLIRARYHPLRSNYPFALQLRLHLHRYHCQERAGRLVVYQSIDQALNKASRLLIARWLGLVQPPSALSAYGDIEAIKFYVNHHHLDKDLNGMTTAQWFQEKLNKGLLDDYCRENPCNFFAKKHRPLSDLLPKFLDLVYWKLDRDGDGDFDKADLQRWASSIK